MTKTLVAAVLLSIGLLTGLAFADSPAENAANLSADERRAMRAARSNMDALPWNPASKLSAAPRPLAPPSTTLIQYDNGNAVQRSGNTGIVVIGNRFDIGGGGNPLAGPWTVTGVTLQNAGTPFMSNVLAVFFNGGATVASVTLSGVGSSLQGFAFATPLTGTGTLTAGIVNSTWSGCTVTSVPPGTTCDGVALDTAQNATNPLGFHAVSVIPGPVAATLGNLNAIFRVTGSNLPVELMSFSVDGQ